MDKILLLAKANIRRAKGQMIILAILFFISAMLLNTGLSILTGFGNHFNNIAYQLNTSDVYIYMTADMFTPEVEEAIRQNSSIYQVNDALGILQPQLEWDGGETPGSIFVRNVEDEKYLSQWKLVGDYNPLGYNSVYVSFLFHARHGLQLGDSIYIVIDDQRTTFTIAGFMENIWSEPMFTANTFLVSAQRYNSLGNVPGIFNATIVYANDVGNILDFNELIVQVTGIRGASFDPNVVLAVRTLDQFRARTQIASMLAVFMVVFTIVITIVSLLAIRFRIKNSIEEDMPKIGSLQATGYTSRQIIGSFVVQYGGIVLFVAVLGIVPSLFLLPVVSHVLAADSGMYWNPGFMPATDIIAVVGLTLVVVLFTSISSGAIKKIVPVLALRGGVKTHSFKRNPFALHKGMLPINAALGLKAVLQGLKQSIMMFVVVGAVSLTAVIALVVFYNSAIDITAFELIPGIERGNAQLVFAQDVDVYAYQKWVNEHPNVRDSMFYSGVNLSIEGESSQMGVMEDYSRRVTQNVFRGVFPRYDNEIAISGQTARFFGVDVGDEILVGDNNQPFLITGLTTGMYGAFKGYITTQGMRSINPDFAQIILMVYLHEGTDAALFVEEMEMQLGASLIIGADVDAAFVEGVSGVAGIMGLVGVVIIAVSAFVIVLVLYFVIAGTIVRRRRDLGVQKAIGYTTGDLMKQIALQLTFPIVLGAAIGTVLGIFAVNPLMTLGMGGMGVMQVNFIVNAVWAVGGGLAIIVLAYVVSTLVTLRIRKISPYKLITE